jgi:tRNA1Val (adenine37-N6)-methyltransferase
VLFPLPPAAFMIGDAACQTRRALFPRGLLQPTAGFRFGADTLLLAAFAARQLTRGKAGKTLLGLDLGTGCGAASIGLLLLRPEIPLHIDGIDTGPEMIAAAAQNAQDLDLGGHFAPHLADVQTYRAPAPVDFILANPPFRVPGTGRSCPETGRDRARFEGPGGFQAFATCAAKNLRRGGALFFVHLTERLPELLATLTNAGLHTRYLLPVQGHAEANPRLALLAAIRGGGSGLNLERPLVLYGPDNTLTPQALAFCPPLTANPCRTFRNPAA